MLKREYAAGPALCLFFVLGAVGATDKPLLTLDEFFNYVSITSVRLSPDGRMVALATECPDWQRDIFRRDLWLYREDGPRGARLAQLTQSGHDTNPKWSPDGRWIAFLSDRRDVAGKSADSGDGEGGKEKEIDQLYLISIDGGEAFPVTLGDEEVHAFAWSSDSHSLFFATRIPWNKAQKDEYKKQWKDVLQYRRAERGDQVSVVELDKVTGGPASAGSVRGDEETRPAAAALPVVQIAFRIGELAASPDGKSLAFATTSISERQEIPSEFEIYIVDNLDTSDSARTPRRLTHNEAFEQGLRWASNSRHLFFQVDQGSVEGKYKDTQERLYWVDRETGQVQRWASDFSGAVTSFDTTSDGSIVAAGRLGTEVQLYIQATPGSAFKLLTGLSGTYERVSAAGSCSRVAFVYSSLERPAEVYLADEIDAAQKARAITSFNKLFVERELPRGKPYRWKSDDGVTVEGMLVYPPSKFEAKNLPTLTLIHGGPADADGNHFEADWYQWAGLAATRGWLVFQPNYRGSAGYGDKFLGRIVPEVVSRPGKDILEGIDALVREGIADPEHLAVAGYSYGGYLTNWLITRTTRFKAAMTGAGAVEHVANWGNDDMTVDDAYFLGGRPWEVPQRYQSEAAIFQIDKVRTPTHMVAGSDDIRVAVLEDYLLDRALHSLGVPSTLLIFPGEGHGLEKNPWHGKIKVREELKWLEKYAGADVGK
jgi:dipeptidyl aminopeptidase/acylaminoacyl peptidase